MRDIHNRCCYSIPETKYSVGVNHLNEDTVEISENKIFKAAAEDSSLLNPNMRQTLIKYKQALKTRSLIVDTLAIFFGIGSWIGVNAIYLQLPLLVNNAPEAWSLPSYLVIIIQMANIGPIIYALLQKYKKNLMKDSYMIYTVLFVGNIACLLTAFLYNYTTEINGHKTSLPLFVLVFFLALTGCTSSVLFMPYMGRFKTIYLITYFIGEGLSGFLPSIIALLQGVGGNAECIPINSLNEQQNFTKYTPPPRFSSTNFFIFIFSITICSFISFILLENLNLSKKQYAAVKITDGNNYEYEKSNDTEIEKPKSELIKNISSQMYKILMILMSLVCFFGNGVFPSIQSYSCLPYGNIVYHLTITLSSMANPVACFLAFFLPHTSIRGILLMIGLSAILTSYVITTSLLSPIPPLIGTVIGEILIVTTWTVLVGLITYTKLCITTVMRSQGGRSLMWIGTVTQIGSAIGSFIIFMLINFTMFFKSYDPCI